MNLFTRRSSLARLERDVLDEKCPLPSVLRQVVALGGRTGSAELRSWALRELYGYASNADELPEYRIVPATVTIDGVDAGYFIEGQQISPLHLADFTHGTIKEEVRLTSGVGQLEYLARRDARVKVDIPMSADLVRIMNYEHDSAVHRLYWTVHRSAVQGTLDQIRTRLTELVAELRATMPPGRSDPTPEQVARVVQNISITAGDNSPIQVAAPIAHADHNGNATINGTPSQGVRYAWTLLLVAAAAVVSAVLTWWMSTR
ncbi:AbiTii domain-containing protein [Kitasatospora purpeofusca]|uniref:AbiTii domain-containing protein n=1 Tax=Kitasatospora purpeofusca TaxID=67352 RepID=UPI003653CF50